MEEQSSGLPQLNPDWFSSQLFWFGATFVALYVIMAWFIVPRIHEILENRQDRINHDLDWASSLKSEAEEAKLNYEKALANARKQANTMLTGITDSIKTTSEKKNHELDEVLKTKLAESEAAIENAKKNAIENLAPVSKEISALVIEKLLSRKPDAKKLDSIIAKLEKGASL